MGAFSAPADVLPQVIPVHDFHTMAEMHIGPVSGPMTLVSGERFQGSRAVSELVAFRHRLLQTLREAHPLASCH